jgi:hypothetical protein
LVTRTPFDEPRDEAGCLLRAFFPLAAEKFTVHSRKCKVLLLVPTAFLQFRTLNQQELLTFVVFVN